MRILVTAGPTREYIDPVRFISNASSGKMGYAVAACAASAGHEVTLISGPVALATPPGVRRVDIVSVADLQRALSEAFPWADALVMSAAVGDFTVESPSDRKISRKGGPITVRLVPTADILAGIAAGKRPDQAIVAFAVETGTPEEIEAKARAEMRAKGADFVVANTPAAMSADDSLAAIFSRDGVVLPWAKRPKEALAAAIVGLLAGENGD